MRRIAACIALACLSIAAFGQETPRPEDESPQAGNPLIRKMLRLADSTRQLGDWSQHASLSNQAAEKIFKRNGWDTESDQWALEMMRAVESVPPWEFNKRGDMFFSLLSKRYELTDEQRQELQRRVTREAFRVYTQHAGQILGYAGEMIEARVAGQPFTAEQVARWAEQMEPVIGAVTESVNRVGKEMSVELEGPPLDRLLADLEAGERRVATVTQELQRWKSGQWSAEDWGMDEDPIQTGAGLPQAGEVAAAPADTPLTAEEMRNAAVLRKREAHEKIRILESSLDLARQAGDTDKANHLESELLRAQEDFGTAEQSAALLEPKTPAAPTGPPVRPVAQAPDPVAPPPLEAPNADAAGKPKETAPAARTDLNDPWARYVDAFIRKYKLDSSQGQRAWLMYDESKRRAGPIVDRLAKQAAESGGKAESAARATEAQDKEMVRIFEQLQSRLERIPTRAQRKNADAMELPDPNKKPAAGKAKAEKTAPPK